MTARGSLAVWILLCLLKSSGPADARQASSNSPPAPPVAVVTGAKAFNAGEIPALGTNASGLGKAPAVSTNASVATNAAVPVPAPAPVPPPATNVTSEAVKTVSPAEVTSDPMAAAPEKSAIAPVQPAGAPAAVEKPTNPPVETTLAAPANAIVNAEPATNAANAGEVSSTAAELGQLPTPAYLVAQHETNPAEHLKDIQLLLELAREQRREKNYTEAARMLVEIMETNAPSDFKRPALFELALVAQDQGKYVKAQQIFAQYLQQYPEDPSTPEVLLRQGLVYRQMGVDSLAISKFYAVMSSSLKLRLENMDYYRKLVLQAQVEIADTHYLDGAFADAADFYQRILKNGSPELNTALIQYKLIRSLSFLTNHFETAAKAQSYLDTYPDSADVPEVRFLLASCFKKLGRNQEAMRQVLLLLQSQQQNSGKNPETWIYWQQRAGNEIANQLYKEGDYMSALQIYLSLAELNKTPEWQLPVWYQTALVYEQLLQPEKAAEVYNRILDRKKEFGDAAPSPGLQSLFEMAKWRKDYLDWLQKARTTAQDIKSGVASPPGPATPTNVLTSSVSP